MIDFDSSYLLYGIAVGWFTYHIFWMAMRIYQFSAFPRTYGTTPCLSLEDLGDAAVAKQRELPAFRVVIPAFKEVEVIDATVRRAAAINYPRTHFEVYVTTYADEPPTADGLTTGTLARAVAEDVNRAAGLDLVHVLTVPSGYDGYFPGDLNAPVQHIGKARGLNFALRSLHEENEREERALYVGLMAQRGHLERIERQLARLVEGLDRGTDTATVLAQVQELFHPDSPDFIGPLALSTELVTVAQVAGALQALASARPARAVLTGYLHREAPRFFLDWQPGREPALQIMTDKQFLFETMRDVERLGVGALEARLGPSLQALDRTRPLLRAALERAERPEEIFQLVRRTHSRWMMVYDADADPPPDVMRHLAVRILREPDVMGFQGPVAPLLNYDDVHPLCRMGALWMAFWHGAAYPRLLHRKHWAHPLAGTNWCFRVEGFERDGVLIRNCDYDESRRRFLLRFDPTQLTEDLEAGLRSFSELSVNAEWHPLVEMEQVPPTPGAMFRQHARWALGTLRTLGYVFRSRLPYTQKAWFLIYPLRVIFASSGPFITLALVLTVTTDVLSAAPIFAWWTLALAVGNLIYVWAFVRTFERYFDMRQRAAAVDCIVHDGDALLRGARHDAAGVPPPLLEETTRRLGQGLEPGGFVSRYLESRCTDDWPEGDLSGDRVGYVAHLLHETPSLVRRDVVARFLRALESPGDRPRPAAEEDVATPRQWEQFTALVRDAATSAGVNRRVRWSRYHTEILLWSIPFIYFSVTPFFLAFRRWCTGRDEGWNKTMRTPKGGPRFTQGVEHVS